MALECNVSTNGIQAVNFTPDGKIITKHRNSGKLQVVLDYSCHALLIQYRRLLINKFDLLIKILSILVFALSYQGCHLSGKYSYFPGRWEYWEFPGKSWVSREIFGNINCSL